MRLFVKEIEYFGHRLTVPEGVEWLATDKDGHVYGYIFEPIHDSSVWYSNSKKMDYQSIAYAYLPPSINWTETKRKV